MGTPAAPPSPSSRARPAAWSRCPRARHSCPRCRLLTSAPFATQVVDFSLSRTILTALSLSYPSYIYYSYYKVIFLLIYYFVVYHFILYHRQTLVGVWRQATAPTGDRCWRPTSASRCCRTLMVAAALVSYRTPLSSPSRPGYRQAAAATGE